MYIGLNGTVFGKQATIHTNRLVAKERTGKMIGATYEGGTGSHRGWCRTGTDGQTGKEKKEDKEGNIGRNC